MHFFMEMPTLIFYFKTFMRIISDDEECRKVKYLIENAHEC